MQTEKKFPSTRILYYSMPVYLPFLEVTSLNFILYVFNNFNVLAADTLENGTDSYGCMKIKGEKKLLLHPATYIKHDLFSSNFVGK